MSEVGGNIAFRSTYPTPQTTSIREYHLVSSSGTDFHNSHTKNKLPHHIHESSMAPLDWIEIRGSYSGFREIHHMTILSLEYFPTF